MRIAKLENWCMWIIFTSIADTALIFISSVFTQFLQILKQFREKYYLSIIINLNYNNII